MLQNNGIPVSVSIGPTLEKEGIKSNKKYNKARLFRMSVLAVAIAVCISFIAKLLVYLIDLFTNLSFFGKLSVDPANPANNSYGLFVILVPVAGGLVVGLMAYYGSKAIRGHGIPEAMEQILTNKSKIKPSITYLKPLSAAISIGTGGPFGAEGPIIATGGALGSTLGQLLKISANERKILLAAGATAGMSAIFGTPIAAILLAIELLLFEFSPRSFVPVALACITGAAGHHLFFEEGFVFPLSTLLQPASGSALLFYSAMGIVIGLLSIVATKIVYFIEDCFEKLPIHWVWWPAIGGLAVGITGYFAPNTLGVGYNNIVLLLSGSMAFYAILKLCLLKFVSWAIALGSGTSGGTLAPLLTIGGATGALFGSIGIYLFPDAGISLPLSALVGMSAMFAGASRAFLTSIVFSLETTGQANALLPLLATCTASYFVSYFLMENTIMTEKIARRGVFTPNSYESDLLEKTAVREVLDTEAFVISENMTVAEVKEWLAANPASDSGHFIVSSETGHFKGIVRQSTLFRAGINEQAEIKSIAHHTALSLHPNDSLRRAAAIMAKENLDSLPVVLDSEIIGILTAHHVISGFREDAEQHEKQRAGISLKRQGLKILVKGQHLLSVLNPKNND